MTWLHRHVSIVHEKKKPFTLYLKKLSSKSISDVRSITWDLDE